VAARRADDARGDQRSHSGCQLHFPPSALQALLRWREEDHPPCRAYRRRRLLGVRGVCDRRAHSPAAGRRRRRAGRALSTDAQVALYQSGDVDFLVATDAIGMGLNLDVDHVAFAGSRKFDGQVHRELTPGELGQIAGRAGRHMNDGTFGVTGTVEPYSADVIDRLETHTFEPVKSLQWRNRDLDFASLDLLP